MSKKERLGFLGAGNMATAIIKGIIDSNIFQREQLMASDSLDSARMRASEQFGIETSPSNRAVVGWSSVVVLSVKPQIVDEVLKEVAEDIGPEHLVISIAAGVPLGMMETLIGKNVPIIRVMPNTPALIQKGISVLAGGSYVEKEHMALGRKIFGAVGDTVELDEENMDSVTALSGSGPAYVFRMMECMVKAGASVGLREEVCTRLVIQTVIGAAHLAKESNKSLSSLRKMVTSPGGTTEAGLKVLDSMGFEDILEKTVKAAYNRSVELGKGGK